MRQLLLSGGGIAASSSIAVRPPSWWIAKFTAAYQAYDISYFGAFAASANSYGYYTLALSICGNTRLGKADGDNAFYYDRALAWINAMIDHATPQAGGYLGWRSTGEKDGGEEKALREIYAWRFVAEWLEYVQGIPRYAADFVRIRNFTRDNIFKKWQSRGPGSNIYREVIHIAAHWAKICLHMIPLLTDPADAAVRTQMQIILDDIDHEGMSSRGNASCWTHLRPHPVDPDADWWPMYWNGTVGAGGSEPSGSDVSHGEGFITYYSDARRKGYGFWTPANDQRLLRAKDIYWSGGHHWEFLIGPACKTEWDGKYVELGTLGQFDRRFQRQLEDDEVRDRAAGAEKWGTFALNALRLGGPYL